MKKNDKWKKLCNHFFHLSLIRYSSLPTYLSYAFLQHINNIRNRKVSASHCPTCASTILSSEMVVSWHVLLSTPTLWLMAA